MPKYSYKVVETRSILVEVKAKSRKDADRKVDAMIEEGELEDELFSDSEREEINKEFLFEEKKKEAKHE